MPRHHISGRPAATLPLALVAAIAIAACGGSSPSGSSAASITKAGLEAAACMRTHGVPDFPDPGSGKAGSSGNTGNTGSGGQITVPPGQIDVDGHILSEPSETVAAAYKKCEKYAVPAQGPPVSTAQLARLKAGALAYAKCVRAHGVANFPDPTVETGPGGHGAGITPPFGTGARAEEEARSPTLQAAIKTCGPLVDKAMPGLGGTNG
jgi:hypothetical protein